VFALKEPDGYGRPNLNMVRLGEDSGGKLVAFARVDPADQPVKRAEDALGAGARGIKLHPSSDEFDIDDPRLDPIYRLADADRLPVLVHAGPEVKGVGETALAICRRFPGLRMILAHNALTDLSWIWAEIDDHPNLFFDTSWWGPVHTMALFALIPPGRILSASDLPYCSPLSGAFTTLRCGLQAGLVEEQLRLVMGEQFERLLGGHEPADGGPAAGPPREALDPLLERVFVTLLTGLEPLQRGEDMGNALDVTRHALKVRDSYPKADVFRACSTLLDLYEAHKDSLPRQNPYSPGWDLVAAAAVVARTPEAPLPEIP
jgi:hypothetical protein